MKKVNIETVSTEQVTNEHISDILISKGSSFLSQVFQMNKIEHP